MCLSSNYKHVWWRFPWIWTNTNVALWLWTSMDKPTIIIDSWTTGAWHSQFESPAKRPSFWGPEVTLHGLSCVVLRPGARLCGSLEHADLQQPYSLTMNTQTEVMVWICFEDLLSVKGGLFLYVIDLLHVYLGKKSKENVWKREKNPVCHTLAWVIFLH